MRTTETAGPGFAQHTPGPASGPAFQTVKKAVERGYSPSACQYNRRCVAARPDKENQGNPKERKAEGKWRQQEQEPGQQACHANDDKGYSTHQSGFR